MIVENDTVYISDNLGYLYAYNYIDDKYIWLKITRYHLGRI